MRLKDKVALDNILDIMSGADGGIGFVKLRGFIDTLGKQADDGDIDAETVLRSSLHSFNRLIKLAGK